jgi:hypothetical protein
MPEKELMTDDELCDALRITRDTLRRHMRLGPPRKLRGAGDVRTIRHICIGSKRRWARRSVEEFIHGE